MDVLTVIDLFSGAGGLSVAAAKAGGAVRMSVEIDPTCCETLRINRRWHSGDIVESDVAELSGAAMRKRLGLHGSDRVVIIGGAPCQPFSKAAYWTDRGDDARYRRARARGESAQRPTKPLGPRPDARRTLVREFWRIVGETRAAGFVFENVPSLLHPRNRPELESLQSAARTAGFATRLIVANAAHFGVAQKRVRVFLLGARREPEEVRQTHTLDEPRKGLRAAVTASAVMAPYTGPEYFEAEEVVKGRWAQHLRTVPPGWNYKAHTAWAGHPHPTFETETRFWNFLLKLHPEQPSWTIAANPGPWTGPFHWDSRRLRTTELAALQGFPKGYRFAGTRREKVRQIGNAVPPAMAVPMIESVLRAVSASGRG
jgi:DNA (cytosine-5)-methyltransferase 1